ncbi:oxidoreductase [Planctomycetaceae bacterium SCGC AG-212-F19]|nr:oxidoreductase [Planctomycetaceae bacterium SCGC AG-212-F19]
MPRHLHRRRFLQGAAAGIAGLGTALRAADEANKSANDKLNVGVIGVAGQGAYNLGGVAGAGANIVALCDVDEKRTGKAREQFPQAKYYTDFRQLLDQKGIDAVVVATPDHTHAVATMMALKAGLHVYCEKPLTHTVHEARVVAETAAKQKRITQMGTQIHAGTNYRRVVELVQGGAIGPVTEVHVWCGKSWGGGDRPKDTPAIPEGLHYDLWLGPAPQRPYHPAYVPFNWRKFWDFGGGTLADMACHYMDLPFWALKLRHPTKVIAEGPPPHPETAAVALLVTYEFPARDNLPPVKFTWYDGGKRPALFAEGKLPKWGDGVLFVGAKGMLLADYSNRKLLPEKDFAGFTPPAPTIPNSIGHHKEWVEACKNGGPTTCNFDYSGALTETVLLGNVAYRLGRPITWDAKNLKAVGEPEADKLIHKEYRKPWTL